MLNSKRVSFKLYIVLFLILSINKAFAQSPNQYQNMIDVGTTSPEVASLGKFGNVPVGYITGIPNITIPVFEIKVGDIKLPISLDYHAGGIRVDEVSSSVGIGWALNAGRSVSRSLVGLPDESTSGYLNSPPFSQVYSNESTYYDYLYNVMEGLSDATPDVFSYGIEGQTAKFIIKKSDHSFIQFPATNNKIENYAGTCYKITNQNGLAYIYEQKENTSFGTVNNVNLVPRYTSAWRLTKIVSSNLKDTVFITYNAVLNLNQHSRSFTHTIGTSPSSNYGTVGYGDVINSDSYTSQWVYNDESYVKEINWRGGKIAFINTADRSDYSGAMRIREIDVYSKSLDVFSLQKKIKLNQSYFYYKPANYSDGQDPDGVDPYRLRLDSVQFFETTGTLKPQVYSMTYDNTPMAPRESFGQDQFGFNNGHFDNITLMPSQTVLYNVVGTGNSYYTFGNANRNFDANFIKACTIQSMKYPTGGKTVYEMEPHRYNTQTSQVLHQSIESISDGSLRSSNSVSFTLTADMSNLSYNVNISAYNYPDVSNRPTAYLTDQTTGQEILRFTNMNASQSYTTGLNPITNVTGPYLTVGHTYVLTTNIYTTNVNVKATFDVYWDLQTTVPLVLQGAGLRVKTITNYDINGSFISQKRYDYTDDGTGILLTPAQYLGIYTTNTIYRRGNTLSDDNSPHATCMYSTGNQSVIYHSNSVIPASQLSGSPVLYNKITEYDVTSAGATQNGKKVMGYPISVDQQVLANNNYTYGVQMISNVWRNGNPSAEDIYKSNSTSGYDLVESKRYNYVTTRQSTEQMLRVQPRYSYSFDATSCNTFNSTSVYDDIILDSYNLPTAALLLQSESDIIYDNAANPVTTSTNYSYNDATHLLPTQKDVTNSKQETLTTILKYPHDLASGSNVYQTMVNRNIISPIVNIQQIKNGTQMALANINYNDWFGNGTILLPQTVDEQVLSNPIESRTKFIKYDTYGNILEQQKTNGPVSAYKWGYYNLYPVATINNATTTEFYYESFEESTASGVVATGTAHTGTRYTTTSSISWTRPNSRSYLISYWYLTSGVWKYSGELPYTADTYNMLIATGYDDIRIYPADAQLKTYTYFPLVGITSTTDTKGQTTYYEYDGFQRLINIKDKDGNIIKHTDYHYQGQ